MRKREPWLEALVWSFIAPAVAAAACSTSHPAAPASQVDPVGHAATRPTEAPTFYRDVEPLLQTHCLKCHQPGGLAPFSLATYAEANAMAPAMAVETSLRRMPPWGAQDAPDCKPRLPWAHDERLTDREIATIAEWSATGAPEGDPADAPPAREAVPIELSSPTMTLVPKAPFVASGSRDQYRCFVFDPPELADGGWIDGINVVPGNRKVVHHAIVMSDANGAFADKAGPDGSFECAGMSDDGMGVDRTLLQVWVPGAYPIDLPPNIGMRIEPGAKIVMRVHYSPAGRAAEPDATKVQLRLARTPPEFVLATMDFGDATNAANGLLPDPDDDGEVAFRIPANVRDHVETMKLEFRPKRSAGGGAFYVYGVMGHAHLAAIDVKVDVEHDGDRQCLLDDRWDFHWQRMYTYAALPEALPKLELGDTITIRCTYDNSMNNRRLGAEYAARGLVPMDIQLGEQTLDEMCLFIPQLLTRSERTTSTEE